MKIERNNNGHFAKGRSANAGGRKSLGLSKALRESCGAEAWAMAMRILRGEILEPYFDQESKETIYLSPGAKTRLEAVKIVLSYAWGTAVAADFEERRQLEQRIKDLETRLDNQWQQVARH